MILRLLRYVSPNPWGCVSAEAHRRTQSLNGIAARIFWSTDPSGPPKGTTQSSAPGTSDKRVLSTFSAGSDVAWTPSTSTVRPDGSIRIRRYQPPAQSSSPESSSAITGWLIHRLPPPSRARSQKHAGGITFTVRAHPSSNLPGAPSEQEQEHRVFPSGTVLPLDSTSEYYTSDLEILFDCRFLIKLNVPGIMGSSTSFYTHVDDPGVGALG